MRVLGPVYKNKNPWYSHSFTVVKITFADFFLYGSMNEEIIFNSHWLGFNFECWNSRQLPVLFIVGDNTLIWVGYEVFKKQFMGY